MWFLFLPIKILLFVIVIKYILELARLIKLKIELDKSALRHPITVQQILDRKKWERVRNILIKRYKRYE